MITQTKILIILAAGVGGAAANLVDLAQVWTGREPWLPSAIYYAGLAIFFGLGAGLALIFSETDYRKAFFLGVSLPALIAATQTQVDREIPLVTAPTEKTEFLQFIPTAHAQQTGVSDRMELARVHKALQFVTRMLELTPRKNCSKCDVWFYNKNGQILQKQPFPDHQGTFMFDVPQGTTHFGIWNKTINPKLWSLPANPQAAWSFQFDYKSSIWNDFRRGLGNYNIKPYNPEISPEISPGDAAKGG